MLTLIHSADAYWHVWATFAPQKLAEGLASVRTEVTRWVSDGITEKELETIKNTLIGTHEVSLADTKGFASNLLTNYKRGWPVSFLDEYPQVLRRYDIVARLTLSFAALGGNCVSRVARSTTLAQVNASLRKYVSSDKLTTIVAGTIDDALLQSKI